MQLLAISPTNAEDSVPVFDLHSDIILRAIDNGVNIAEPPDWAQVSIPSMKAGNVQNQVFAIWVNSRRLKGLDATIRAMEMIDLMNEQVDENPADITIVRNMVEADAAKDAGKIAAWMWLEGGAPINDSIHQLRAFHEIGVVGMTLTWMNNLSWAGASTDRENPNMGLNELGREVVAEMNKLGMIVDVSHVSEQTFYDAIEASSDPVVASHSSCRALADHPRNLDDDQLRALATNGGVIGVAIVPSYLSTQFGDAWDAAEIAVEDEIEELRAKYDGDTSNPLYREGRRQLIQGKIDDTKAVTIETYLDHIEHAIEVAGWEHVGLGSDYDGIWAFPVGLEKPTKWPAVAQGLRDRGHSEEVVRAVMHDNMARVFHQVIDE